MQFRIFWEQINLSDSKCSGELFHLNYFEIKKLQVGQKLKKLKNDVLEIALDQWNERVDLDRPMRFVYLLSFRVLCCFF